MNTTHTTAAPEGFEAARARLRAWNPFAHHTHQELMAHEADLQLMPDDGGTDGPAWAVRQ